MAYDAAKDPLKNAVWSPASMGVKGRPVTPHNDNDLDPYAKAIVVVAAGNLVIIPAKNADDAPITFTACPVGFIPPYRVRRVKATGTTATVATIDDD